MKIANNRRRFIQKSVVGLISVLGSEVIFAKNLPKETTILGETPFIADLPEGKNKDLILLNDRPWNIETPPHLLDEKVTPADKMFVRNNGNLPENIDAKKWELIIEGESAKTSKIFTINDLKTKFKTFTYQLTLECAGNGRYGYSPQTSGNQWQDGAVSCAEWTGVRLRDILESVGIKDDAVYIGYYGKDTHLSGDAKKSSISRGVPMKKALEDETLLAWAMNGQDIPLQHGFPLRLVIGGWPASVSGKWLNKIAIRNKVHDGEKMSGHSYRVPMYPVEAGATVPDNELKIIESMPVKSLITFPKTGAIIEEKQILDIRGHAWSGDFEVAEMNVSIDFGATWQKCELSKPKNRLAWQQWSAKVSFPRKGYYEVWAKATDARGISQPMVIPAWNPGGYLNNSCHRIAVKIS